jgi:hypothetical protein
MPYLEHQLANNAVQHTTGPATVCHPLHHSNKKLKLKDSSGHCQLHSKSIDNPTPKFHKNTL